MAGDRTSDKVALNQYLLPDLRRAGFSNPLVETLPSNPTDQAASSSAATLVVQRLKAAGVNSVIPLIPFNSFFPFLAQETPRTTSRNCSCRTTSPRSRSRWA